MAMAFLFKSKKQQQSNIAAPPQARDVSSSGPGSNSSLSTTNGSSIGREKLDQTPTPGGSVNNSLNSLGGTGTPSPELKSLREGDLQVSTYVVNREAIL